MKGEYVNFWKATACSVIYFTLYLALYSAQNIQSLLFEEDSYGKLGFYSNAIDQLGQLAGAFAAPAFMGMIGDINTMAWGAVASIPFIVGLLIPAFKY